MKLKIKKRNLFRRKASINIGLTAEESAPILESLGITEAILAAMGAPKGVSMKFITHTGDICRQLSGSRPFDASNYREASRTVKCGMLEIVLRENAKAPSSQAA